MADTPGVWMRLVTAGVTATSEATFPDSDTGAPDWRSTEMVPRTLEYLEELPPRQRRLVQALFVFVELAAIFLLLRGRRFSRLPVPVRTEAIRRWRASRYLVGRILGDSLKATATMMYLSHPRALEWMGEYRACERPLDRIRLPVRPDALEPRDGGEA
ncbi:MAG: hypothetical protein IT376_04050 [Polyangiaceae bacterium]|nr:hypothetical protein [Polyangiaceae bacterium]